MVEPFVPPTIPSAKNWNDEGEVREARDRVDRDSMRRGCSSSRAATSADGHPPQAIAHSGNNPSKEISCIRTEPQTTITIPIRERSTPAGRQKQHVNNATSDIRETFRPRSSGEQCVNVIAPNTYPEPPRVTSGNVIPSKNIPTTQTKPIQCGQKDSVMIGDTQIGSRNGVKRRLNPSSEACRNSEKSVRTEGVQRRGQRRTECALGDNKDIRGNRARNSERGANGVSFVVRDEEEHDDDTGDDNESESIDRNDNSGDQYICSIEKNGVQQDKTPEHGTDEEFGQDGEECESPDHCNEDVIGNNPVRIGDSGRQVTDADAGEINVDMNDVAARRQTSAILLSEDAAMLRRTIIEIGTSTTTRVGALDQKFGNAIEDLKKRLDDTNATILELYTLVVASQHSGANRSRRQMMLDARVAFLDRILTDTVVQNVMEQVVVGVLTKQLSMREAQEMRVAGGLCLKALMFSRLPSEKLEKYKTESGAMHSNLRQGVILTTVRALQIDSLGLFVRMGTFDNQRVVDERRSISDNNSVIAEAGCGRIRKPAFIDAITRETCEKVREGRENTTTADRRKKEKVTETITTDELAFHAVSRLYCITTTIFHRSRDAAKLLFFESIGYVCTSWSQLASNIDQGSLKLWWGSSQLKEIKFSDVQEVITMSFIDRKENDGSIGEEEPSALHNSDCITKVERDYPELILFIEHDVHICTEEDTNSRSLRRISGDMETRKLTRAVSLVEFGCKMLATYTSMGAHVNAKSFVACNKDSLRGATIIASVIRSILDKIVRVYEEHGISWKDSDVDVLNIKSHGISVGDLLPPRSKQKDSLGCNILKLTAAEYDAINTNARDPLASNAKRDAPKPCDPIVLDDDANVFSVGEEDIPGIY